MAGLTDRQCEWCRLVARGVSKAEAYRKAFNRNDMSADAASKAAYRLSKHEGVQVFLDELRGMADVAAVLGREERMRMLSRCAVRAEEGGQLGDVVRCVAELNKMDGGYAAAEVKVSGDDEFRAAVLGVTGGEPLVR